VMVMHGRMKTARREPGGCPRPAENPSQHSPNLPGDSLSYGNTAAPTQAAGMAGDSETRPTQPGDQLIGPLESFVPPASCFTEFEWYASQTIGSSGTAVANWGGRTTDTAGLNRCYPPTTSSGSYFSPGSCPEGWTVVSTVIAGSTVGPTSLKTLSFSLPVVQSTSTTTVRPGFGNSPLKERRNDPETTLLCCPRYDLILQHPSGNPAGCVS